MRTLLLCLLVCLLICDDRTEACSWCLKRLLHLGPTFTAPQQLVPLQSYLRHDKASTKLPRAYTPLSSLSSLYSQVLEEVGDIRIGRNFPAQVCSSARDEGSGGEDKQIDREKNEADESDSPNDDGDALEGSIEGKLKSVMISWIRWYRETLSPGMPPNCRFFPSSSKYAIQAIEEFGPLKGGILIAWRLTRCNPLGGSGYDPPEWPPPNYFRKNYQPPMNM